MDSSTILSLRLKEILCSLASEKASSNSRVSHISSSPSLFLALFQFWHHGLGKRSLPPTFPSGRSAVPSQFLIDSSHFYSHSRNIQLLFVHRYLWLRIGRIRNLEGIFPTPNSDFSKYVFTRVDHSLNIEYSHSFWRGENDSSCSYVIAPMTRNDIYSNVVCGILGISSANEEIMRASHFEKRTSRLDRERRENNTLSRNIRFKNSLFVAKFSQLSADI